MEAEFRMREAQALRDVNRVIWDAPSQPAIISARTTKTFQFQVQTAGLGDTLLATIQSGDEMLWGPNCYLKIKWDLVGAGGAGTLDFGTMGSVFNFFDQIFLDHSSGEPLEQIQYLGVLANVKARYNTSSVDQLKLSSLLGAIDKVTATAAFAGGFTFGIPLTATYTADAQNIVNVANGDTGKYTSMIPLSYLLGTFDRVDQYIPPGYLAGANLRIILAQSANVGTYVNCSIPSTMRPTLVLDCSKLYDSAYRAILDEQSSEEGIQFSYTTWFSMFSISNNTNFSIDINQSASVTEKVFFVLRKGVPTNGVQAYTFYDNVSQYQWRIAAEQKPQQPVLITIGAAGGAEPQSAEAYYHTLNTFESGLHSYHIAPGNGVGVGLHDFAHGCAVYGTTLERSACGLSLTGGPTNNSNPLHLDITTIDVPDGVSQAALVYVSYLRVAFVHGRNVTVNK